MLITQPGKELLHQVKCLGTCLRTFNAHGWNRTNVLKPTARENNHFELVNFSSEAAKKAVIGLLNQQ